MHANNHFCAPATITSAPLMIIVLLFLLFTYVNVFQGYTDNSGLGPILAEYLQDESANDAQIFVSVINQLGDHQMETYFNSTGGSNGGMMCAHEYTDKGTDALTLILPLALIPTLNLILTHHSNTNLTLAQTRIQAHTPHLKPWAKSTSSHFNGLEGNIEHAKAKAIAF